VIVFTSDHGYHMGEHGLWQKMSLFEESARVPMLIVAPGAGHAGGVVSAPVSQVDLFPTLAELCGVTPPTNLQGQSLVPMLKDNAQTGRGWALTQVTRGGGGGQQRNKKAADNSAKSAAPANDGRFFGYSLRTERWRYTEWDGGQKGRELYDHDTDPRELTNLANHADHSKTVEQLATLMREAVKTTLPASGEIPEVQPGLWAPLLTEP
jgi:iduronate 2-sulfatase